MRITLYNVCDVSWSSELFKSLLQTDFSNRQQFVCVCYVLSNCTNILKCSESDVNSFDQPLTYVHTCVASKGCFVSDEGTELEMSHQLQTCDCISQDRCIRS